MIHAAASGDAALALVNDGAAPYVLTDIHMPGMSGIELAQRITASHPGVRLAAMTAYPDELTLAVASGAFEGVIEKPIDASGLPSLVDWLFFRRRLI